LRKLLLLLETKNLKKTKIWAFVFLGFFKKPKNLGFLKATSTALLQTYWRKTEFKAKWPF